MARPTIVRITPPKKPGNFWVLLFDRANNFISYAAYDSLIDLRRGRGK